MNIFYWAVANLLYSKNNFFDNNQTFHDFFNSNKIASIVFIAVISAYAILRFCFNKIGGLYMFKKLAIAVILAGAVYDKPGFLGYLLGL